MAHSSNTNGIARIVRLMPDGPGEKHVGMAFVVGPRHAITCCHVLNDALGRTNRLDPEKPAVGTSFIIQFPYAGRENRTGVIHRWGLELSEPKDVAVLELDQDAPARAGLAFFSDVEVHRERWFCIGWDTEGVDREVDGTFGTVLARGERQLNGAPGAAPTIAPGYSGAPIWCEAAGSFVGTVVSSDVAHHENKLAYAIPTSVLRQIWPQLPQVLPTANAPAAPARFEAEPASPRFVERNELMAKLQKILARIPRPPSPLSHGTQTPVVPESLPARSRRRTRPVTRVALHGPGGAGKTKVVAAFARANEARFPDGVLWGTLGQKPNVEEILSSWGRGLGDKDIPLGGYESVPAATKSLTSLLRRKQCLLILDDAWDPNLVRDTFQIEGPFCLLLVTTRKKAVGEAIGAEVVNVEGMTLRESMTLLKNWAGPIPKRSLDVAQSLASEVGFLPLALELIGAQAKKLGWQEYKRRWDEPRPLGVLTRTPDAEGKQDSVRDSIELSAASLRNDRRARFYDLAVFPEKALFPASACGALWGIDDGATLDLLLAFVDDALLEQRTISDRPRFVFHDLIREFVKEQRADIRSSHQSLVNGYSERCAENWSTLRQDGYVHDRIAYHMARAEDISSLRGLLTKPWFDVQAQRTGSVLAAASDLETGIALVRTKSPNDFCDLFRWCYARALLGSTATELPPALLGALVLLDETDRARGYAALVGAPERRASAYLRMSAAAWHRAERDTAVEFLRHAHSAVVAMVDSGNRIGLLSELALSAQTIGEETLVAGAVDELLRDARAGGQNEYWAVQNAYEAARTLAALGRKGEAAALIRTAVDLAALDKDEMRTVALIVGIAAVLRSCGLEEEARAIDVRAEDALESANRSISEGKSVSTYSFDLVSSFIESGELDSALIIADRWVIGSLSGWSYPHALSRVSSALQSVGRRAEANTVATRALDAAKQRLVASEGNSFEFLKGEQTRSLSAVGVALVRCGETASAIDLADRLASPESRVIVLAALAEVLAGSSDSMETARSLVAKCIEPSPSTFSASADEAAALTSLGQGLARLQSETQARKVVEHVQTMLHTLKDDGWKWKNITLEVAKGFALLGDVERARSTIGLSEADASDATSKRDAPSELLVHQLEIAETLAESGRLAEATVLAEEVAKTEGLQDPREATVFVLACTARLFARLKDGKRALEYARRAKPFLQRARRPQDTIRSNEFDEANAAIVTCMAAYVSVDEAVKFVRSAADPEGMPGVLTRAIEMLWDIGGTACALDIARHLVELSASHRDVLAEAYAMAGAHAQAEQEARQILNQVWPLKVNALSTNWRGVRRRRAG